MSRKECFFMQKFINKQAENAEEGDEGNTGDNDEN